MTRERLSDWGACGDTCDSAALIVSELVTNAIVHTASENVVCELHDGAELVRIAVRDEGCAPGEPHPSPRRPEEEHGRGLLLVEALCRAWGAQETGPGLLVWAELPRRAAPSAPRDLSCSGDRSRPDPGDGSHTGSGGRTGPGDAAGRSDAAGPGDAAGSGRGTAPCSDLGWSAKKPRPDGGRGGEADAFRNMGSAWM
jgi:hypothetical protein